MSIPAGLDGLKRALSNIEAFSRVVLGRGLRPYQVEVARAILQSVEVQAGRTITVMMPRQSGKNETSAQLEAYLLTHPRSSVPTSTTRPRNQRSLTAFWRR